MVFMPSWSFSRGFRTHSTLFHHISKLYVISNEGWCLAHWVRDGCDAQTQCSTCFQISITKCMFSLCVVDQWALLSNAWIVSAHCVPVSSKVLSSPSKALPPTWCIYNKLCETKYCTTYQSKCWVCISTNLYSINSPQNCAKQFLQQKSHFIKRYIYNFH